LKIGQTGEAVAHFGKAVELAPDTIEFRVGFADALSRAGRLPDAIAQLQKSIDISGGQDGELVRDLRARLASYEQAQRR
jgi:Flp pilus assembly protein TadD